MQRRDVLKATAGLGGLALASGGIGSRPALAGTGSKTPSADFPFQKKRAEVLGSEMAFVDEGSGRPIVFLHGNPTSSYLWRNIIPHVTGGHRAIAPDLIGMGDSAQPDIAYRYPDHARHLHALLDRLDLNDAVLVIHDWGSALGLHYARENPGRIAAVAFMEAMVPPAFPFESYEAMGPFADLFRTLRTEGPGEKMVLEENFFVEKILREMGVVTPIGDAAMEVYRRPYPTPESRRPTLQWPREIPIGGTPADVDAIVRANGEWLQKSDIPKLLFYAEPGALTPPQAAEWLSANLSNIETRFLGAGQHFVQEDHPEQIGRGIADWLRRI